LTDAKAEFVEQLPKAEIHVHLEGAIQPATVIDLADRNDVDLPFETVEEAREYYEFDGLAEFLEVFALACSTLQTPADFERVTVDLAADAARQNIPYREVFFTYAYHESRGVPWETVVEGIASGREIAREEASILGIGLDSQEQGYPAHRHQPAFDRAGELGFKRLAHAGEDVGPGSVWDALVALDVDRIDHGVRSVEDEILLEYLDHEAVPLTTCPVSNVALDVYPEIADHPIGEFLDRGLNVSINSDDPPMFHADLTENFKRVTSTFDLSTDEIVTLARNSFEATFIRDGKKQMYLDELEETAASLRPER